MRKTYLQYIAFVLILLPACNEQDPGPVDVMSNDYQTMEFSMDSLFSDYKIIPLSGSSSLEQIVSIQWEDTILYVGTFNCEIHRFNEEGEAIGAVHSIRGRGPGEILAMDGMVVRDGHMYINDLSPTSKILVYDLDIHFINQFDIPKELQSPSMEILDKHILLFERDRKITDTKWVSLSMNGELEKVVKSYVFAPDFWSKGTEKPYIFHQLDGISYYRRYDDTIFHISDQLTDSPKLVLSRSFKDGKNYPSLEEMTLHYSHELKNHRKLGPMLGLGRYILLIQYVSGNPTRGETILYDKKTKHSYLISSRDLSMDAFVYGIPFDWFGKGYLYPFSTLKHGDDVYFCCVTNAFYLHRFLQEEIPSHSSNPQFLKDFSRLRNKLKVEDNPVLLLFKLREDIVNS